MLFSFYRRALKIDEQAFGPLSREVARDDLALASTLIVVGGVDEAQTALKHARSVGDKQGDLLLISSALDQMALLAAIRSDPAEGLIHTEAMFNAVEQWFGAGSPALVPSLAQLGRFYLLTGRMNDATQVMERITSIIGSDPSEQSPGFWSYLQFRAMLFAEQDDIGQAEATFKKARSVATKYGGSEAIEVAFSELNLAITYLKVRRFDEAISSFKAALAILKAKSGDKALIVGYALAGAANAYAGKGDQATSARLLASAIEILGPTIGKQPRPRWL
jgi:tetratricopeptide (TPR) repeat protein